MLVKTKDSTPAVGSLFQQIQRARNVGVDEVLTSVRSDVGLVQGGGVEDRTVHRPMQLLTRERWCNRADVGSVRGVEYVEADDLVSQVPQGVGQGLAEVTGASRNQDSHDGLTPLLLSARVARRRGPGSGVIGSRGMPPQPSLTVTVFISV